MPLSLVSAFADRIAKVEAAGQKLFYAAAVDVPAKTVLSWPSAFAGTCDPRHRRCTHTLCMRAVATLEIACSAYSRMLPGLHLRGWGGVCRAASGRSRPGRGKGRLTTTSTALTLSINLALCLSNYLHDPLALSLSLSLSLHISISLSSHLHVSRLISISLSRR